MDSVTLIRLIAGLMWIGMVVSIVVPSWLIFKRVGWSGPLSLLMLVPVVNIITLWIFALSDWPALARRR